jgi:hypothetical protein
MEEQGVEFLLDPTLTAFPQHCPHKKQIIVHCNILLPFLALNMDSDDASSVLETPEWGTHTRTVSDSSLSTSTEQLALMGFAQRLYSVSSNNDPGIADEKDVLNEAKLLMSLSCIPPTGMAVESGRITPPSDASSCHSISSRQRDSFRFSCPSLSLENTCQGNTTDGESSSSALSKDAAESGPAALLARVLKVEDVDALRLSSEAMARNIMQSYEKAIQWRIQSWIDCLSRILVRKEQELKQQGLATGDNIKILRESSEAMLIVRLREIRHGIKVIDACNHFNVLPQKVQYSQDEPPHKRRRLSEDLAEGEYEYTVSHALTLEVDLNLQAPAVGNAAIDLKVPGTMNGTFVSFEDGRGHITDVVIDINTDILASMIEKSSRIVVRSTLEMLLKGEQAEPQKEEPQKASLADEAHEDLPLETEEDLPAEHDPSPVGDNTFPSSTPQRTLSVDRVSDFVFVTPRNLDFSTSTSSEESDSEDHPLVILSIPNDFSADQPKQTLTPHMGRNTITSNLPMKEIERIPPSVVTPSKASISFIESDGEGLNLPTLVEVALQLHAR